MHSKRSAQAEHSSRRLQDAFMESLEVPPSNTENALARAPRREGRAVEKNHNQPESDASANKDNNANDTGWLIGYDDAVDDVVAGYIARTEVDGVNDDIEYGALNERDATKDVDAYTAVDYLGGRRNLNFKGDRQMTQSDAFATPNIIYEVQNGDGREYFITFVESDSFVKYDDLADNLKNLAIQVSNLSNNDTPPERKCCKVWRENDQRTHDETRADNGDNNHHHPDSGEAVDNADSHAAFRKVDLVDENEVIELKFEGKGEDTPEKSHPREGCNLKVATYHCAHPCEDEDGQNTTVLFSGRLAAPDLVAAST